MKNIYLLFTLLTIIPLLLACQTDGTDDMRSMPQEAIVGTAPLYRDDVNVCYNIFPIAYADSDGDGFGDLNGISENIDYLANDLMIDCIWLNPIHPSETYHKYDVLDYYDIDPQLGTLSDFEHLIDVADQAGIEIIMDLVINHTGYNHPWFIDSRSSENSDYREWYVWNDLTDKAAFPDREGWYAHEDMYYYASFWSQMPELNFNHEPVRDEIKSIASYWLDYGVSGFRIDAARHIYDRNEYPVGAGVNRKNLDFFRSFNAHIKAIDDDAIILGEIWSNNEAYVAGFYEGMDATFNFTLAESLIETINTESNDDLVNELLDVHNAYETVRQDFIDAIFLTNHDQNRIMNQLNHNEDKTRLAAQMLFTLPGMSWIYYGEELGMTGAKPDEAIRQPFKWGFDSDYTAEGKPNGIEDWNRYNEDLEGVKEQLDDSNSMLAHYRELISLKQSHIALNSGNIENVNSDHHDIVSYVRHHEDQTVLVIHNLKGYSKTITVNTVIGNVLYQGSDDIINDTVISLSPYASVVVELDTTSVTLE